MGNKEKIRIIFSFVVLVVLFSIVAIKAFFVQVVNRDKLIAYSNRQILRKEKIYPNRGNIYDRNGFSLAINIRAYSIFTIPNKSKLYLRNYKKLSQIVPSLSYESILKKVKNRNRYTWLARKISLKSEQVEKIKNLKGVYLEPESKRVYPNHELLSQVLGFVGTDNNGLSGIEYSYDEMLRGAPQNISYIKDAKGRPIRFESRISGESAKDIHLTIDKDIQERAEQYLMRAVVEHKAKSGGIGVIDARTGEVLAMANYPSFNPNSWKRSKSSSRKVSFISDPFEPGSIFKIFTVISALENKIARPDTNYYCEKGRLLVENHVISEAEMTKTFEWLSVSDIIKYSSNVGTTKIAFDLTFPKLKKTLEKFRIGIKTGVELPGESRGIMTERENVSSLRLSNISFGQGVATTGIQMLAAYAAIANGGHYIQPTLVKQAKPVSERIISKDVVKQVQEMLHEAVEKGTGTRARLKMFKIAGKTSTAQKVKPGGGYQGYIPGFIGFPLDVKRPFVIYVYLDEPQSRSYYGGTVAGPVFKQLAHFILIKNKEFEGQIQQLAHETNSLDKVNLQYSSRLKAGKGTTPDFIGLDKLTSDRLASRFGVKIKQYGVGVVEKQIPEAGKKLEKDVLVKLYYAPPKIEP